MDARISGDDVDSNARRTIEQAGAALCGSDRKIPESFLAQLFARAVPEDVVHYGAADLAMLGERAWEFPEPAPAGHAEDPL